MIVVVDYGMGNLRSLLNAFEYLGVKVDLSDDPKVVCKASKLVLPGVGAFGDAMLNLHERNLIKALHESVAERRVPILGICLGMQLFASASEEHGYHQGLRLIAGKVVKLSPNISSLKVPHVGWNEIELKTELHPIFRELSSEAHRSFYFVHSYHAVCQNSDDVLASSNHGQEFSAVIGHENIIGVQFHPEKSQDNGLQLLRNFIEWDGC